MIIDKYILKLLPKWVRDKAIWDATRKLEKINIEDNARGKAINYVAGKCRICIAFLIGTIIFALLYEYKSGGLENISRIKRPDIDSEDKVIDFVVKTEDENRDISINIPKVQKTEEEANKCIEEAYEEAVSLLPGDNKDLDHVERDLFFTEKVKVADTDIYWDTDNYDLIGSDGKLVALKATDEKCNVLLTVSCSGYEKEYIIPVCVVAVSKPDIQYLVQEYVDNQDRTNEEVELPSSIGGKRVVFEQEGVKLTLILIIGSILSVSMFFVKDKDLKDLLIKREEELIVDYPEVLSKYLLITDAGSSSIRAFERMIKDYERSQAKRYAYEEIKKMLKEIKLGKEERKAYEDFSKRIGVAGYVKFGVLLQESLIRGNKNLKTELNKELENAREERRKVIRIRGERAGTKLVFPMVMILTITLMIIVLPAFLGLKGGI